MKQNRLKGMDLCTSAVLCCIASLDSLERSIIYIHVYIRRRKIAEVWIPDDFWGFFSWNRETLPKPSPLWPFFIHLEVLGRSLASWLSWSYRPIFRMATSVLRPLRWPRRCIPSTCRLVQRSSVDASIGRIAPQEASYDITTSSNDLIHSL